MPPTDLDVARARYLAALRHQRPTLDDQIKDLAVVFGQLLAGVPEWGSHPTWTATLDPRPLAAVEPV
jgi:hypothetical protein